MDCQCAFLDEALVTAFYIAVVWSLVGMDSVVSAEIRVTIEALVTVSMSTGTVGVSGLDKKMVGTFPQFLQRHIKSRLTPEAIATKFGVESAKGKKERRMQMAAMVNGPSKKNGRIS